MNNVPVMKDLLNLSEQSDSALQVGSLKGETGKFAHLSARKGQGYPNPVNEPTARDESKEIGGQ